jgi:hypothetical protein
MLECVGVHSDPDLARFFLKGDGERLVSAPVSGFFAAAR